MDTQQVMQQDTALANLANRFSTVLPQNQSNVNWNCPHCGNEVKPVELDGALYRNPICGCIESYKAEEKRNVPPSKRLELLSEAGFTLKLQDELKIKEFNPRANNLKNGVAVLKKVEVFCSEVIKGKKNAMMSLEGNYGTGKTHLSCGATMRMMYQLPATGYMADFVRINQITMENNALVNHYIDLMCKCTILLIDDLDKKAPGKQMLEALKSVLEYRQSRYNKITVITSNRGLAKLHSYWSKNSDFADISAAITRRLADMQTCAVRLDGDAYGVQYG